MNAFFKELGDTVRTRWMAENFSLAGFPEIARAALEEQPPADRVDLAALVRDFLLEDDQPFQTESGFGQPELVVHDDPRFYIQLLFWLDGTTDIHQHMFSGAFHVLAGSSIHSQFRFENPESISAHVRVGTLRLQETHLLETGSTVPIISGPGHIHSLFHLETPSVTVVVRTHTDPGSGPQFTYLPPHVAIDPFHHDALTIRRKQLLDVLEQAGDPAHPELALKMIAELDFERGFLILQNCIGGLRELGLWEEALQVFETRHGRIAGLVAPTLDEIIRRDALAVLRASVTDPEHRFFLALLLNLDTREAILGFVAQRFSGPPVETVMRWAEELCESSESGAWIVDAGIPNTRSASMEEHAAFVLAALRKLMGAEPDDAEGDLEPVRAAFAESSWRALVSRSATAGGRGA